MGGALSGESLKQAIEQYKKMCEKSIKKLPDLGTSSESVSSYWNYLEPAPKNLRNVLISFKRGKEGDMIDGRERDRRGR